MGVGASQSGIRMTDEDGGGGESVRNANDGRRKTEDGRRRIEHHLKFYYYYFLFLCLARPNDSNRGGPNKSPGGPDRRLWTLPGEVVPPVVGGARAALSRAGWRTGEVVVGFGLGYLGLGLG